MNVTLDLGHSLTQPSALACGRLRPQAAALRCLAIGLAATLLASTLNSQTLDPLQQPVVGIKVVRSELADERGSGFVISVDNEKLYILTARHLFYSGKDPFRENILVTFALDPLKDYPAEWLIDFEDLDLAVLNVSLAKLPDSLTALLKDLPPLTVRSRNQPLKLREDIFLLGGKFQDWQLPKDTISGLQDTSNHVDRFRFTGTGVHDGFSGSAILDSSNRLVGIHLGAVADDDSYGRAQRITDAISTLSLSHIPRNKLELDSVIRAQDPAREIPPAVGDVKMNRVDGANYVWIAAGRFQMGCSPNDHECYNAEKPAHPVTIAQGFWLGQTPVTQAAYERVMKRANPSSFKGADRPVEGVTWDEANSYCQSIGGRLPKEAEWEYAARAGSTANRYGPLDQIAWYDSNSSQKTHPVAAKKPNAWNLFDMLGNVFVWTADWYDGAGSGRAVRGGSWMYGPRDVRVSLRFRGDTESRHNDLGVRCVVE